MSISVVIPAFNGAAFIRDALESVYSQTMPPDEIVVVDDASTDGTPALLHEMAENAPVPVRLIVEPHNHGGPAGPLNVGIAAAAGDLIAVLDQDDVFLPEKLEQQSRVLREHPGVAAVAGICAPFPGVEHEYVPAPLLAEISHRALAAPPAGGDTPPGGSRPRPGLPAPCFLAGADALHILMGHGNFLMGFPGFMFRKAGWSARGGLDTSLKIAADLDFFCWLCTQGTVAFLPIAQYRRREHGANLCRDRFGVESEMQRVFLRYQWQAKRDQCACRLDRALRDQVFGIAWSAKNRGRFAMSARFLFQGFCNWPLDWRMSLGLMKLPLHWLRGCLGRCQNDILDVSPTRIAPKT